MERTPNALPTFLFKMDCPVLMHQRTIAIMVIVEAGTNNANSFGESRERMQRLSVIYSTSEALMPEIVGSIKIAIPIPNVLKTM
jgi:hypothetical protein